MKTGTTLSLDPEIKEKFRLEFIGLKKSYSSMSQFVEDAMKAHLDMPQNLNGMPENERALEIERLSTLKRLSELNAQEKAIRNQKEAKGQTVETFDEF